jgi:Sulfotransferase family
MATYHTIKESADRLLARARRETGIDIIDSEIHETLTRLLHSLNTEAKLNAKALTGFELWAPRILRNRLRILRDFRDHPEILEQKITRPLILTGGPRSGSTKLHKMLGAGDDFKVLYCWQGMCPALHSGRRIEDPTPRVREADAWVRWFDTSSPNAKLTHQLSTLEIEEENLIFEHMFFAPYIYPWFNAPSYLEWSMSNFDIRRELRYMKSVLQYLQWQFHDGDPRPWMMKSPVYPGYESELKDVFPDAVFASTFREPCSVLSSCLGLMTNYHLAYSDEDFTDILASSMVEGLAANWDKYMNLRDTRPDIKVLKIGYPDTTQKAEQVMERIYAHYGVALSDRSRQAMRVWEAENQQYKLGVHAHSLAGFGMSADEVRERFKIYLTRYAGLL